MVTTTGTILSGRLTITFNMKTLIIIFGALLYMAFWFFIGTTAFPFFGWLTGWEVSILPMVLVCLFSFCFVMHIFCTPERYIYYKSSRFRWIVFTIIPPLLISLVHIIRRKYFMPFIWLPLIAVNVASYFYMYEKYYGCGYYGDYIVSHRVYLFNYNWNGYNWLYNGGIRGKFGNKVLNEEYYSDLQIEGDYVNFSFVGGLYSLTERRFIIPYEKTIRTYGIVKEANDGRKGIVSLDGDIIVPFIYRDISFIDNYDGAIAKDMNSNCVILNNVGMEGSTYDEYKGSQNSCTGKKYYVFKNGTYNYYMRPDRNRLDWIFTTKVNPDVIIDDEGPILVIVQYKGVIEVETGDYILKTDRYIYYDDDKKQFHYFDRYSSDYLYYSRTGEFLRRD